MDRKKASKDLKKLWGISPYNTWSNICYGDRYYALSIEREYGMSVDQLAKLLNIQKPENPGFV